MIRPRFHLAIPVDDLDAARRFYGGTLGARRGGRPRRGSTGTSTATSSSPTLAAGGGDAGANPVDGHDVPGAPLRRPPRRRRLPRTRRPLRGAGIEFVIEPYLRFEGRPGEQWTMFFRDPAGNALEFKAFADDAQVFAR